MSGECNGLLVACGHIDRPVLGKIGVSMLTVFLTGQQMSFFKHCFRTVFKQAERGILLLSFQSQLLSLVCVAVLQSSASLSHQVPSIRLSG